ncbi:DUF4352 domain-containing protein [Nocardia sp. NPDC058640]|uniref:DUF4352 domain-containing protein n=1 Tax=Nocardia sp. NPDC058640 TaxID=3346571 RepID=UPI0036690FBD
MSTPQYPGQPYPQQPYGSQPPGYPPRPPKKNNNALIIILAVLGSFVVLCGFGGCIVAMSDNSDEDSAGATFTTAVVTSVPAGAPGADGPAAPGAPAPTAAPPADDEGGATVRDGKFEFTVTGVDPPIQVVGDNPYMQKTAQGEYILVHLTVTNTSNKPQSYWADNQELIDDKDRQFANDAVAGMYANDESVWGSDINPGNKIQVVVVFDVPVGTTPAALELHDSAFSNGARVSLR